jgi:hypothetical protein
MLPRAGDEWCPVPDSEPAGPFFGVLVSGRVMVEIGPVGDAQGSLKGEVSGGFVEDIHHKKKQKKLITVVLFIYTIYIYITILVYRKSL